MLNFSVINDKEENFVKLLIVEDEIDIAELISDIFELEAQQIFIANNGEEALETWKANPDIDTVISDINMPKMNGLELCRELRQQKPDLRIILITAECAHEEEAIKCGANHIVIKPFNMEDLRFHVLNQERMLQVGAKV